MIAGEAPQYVGPTHTESGRTTFFKARGTAYGNEGEYVYLGGEEAAYLKIACITNHGDATQAGLTEVLFFEDTSPVAPPGSIISIR